MDLIQEPELKSVYSKSKYKVKVWEHHFKKKHGRLPSKLDIREADRNVRLAYKTYFNLKSNALENSFKDIDGFESDEESFGCKNSINEYIHLKTDVTQELNENVSIITLKTSECMNTEKTWGEHLNKKKDNNTVDIQEKSTVNVNFSQKLFCGSKFSKRNPRKSLSFSHRKSESNLSTSLSLSQPTKSSFLENTTQDPMIHENSLSQNSFLPTQKQSTESLHCNVKIVPASKHINTQPLSIIQSVLDNDYKARKSLDPGWIGRLTHETGVQNENINNFACLQLPSQDAKPTQHHYDSDEVIDNSDDENNTQSILHIAKKIKTNTVEGEIHHKDDFYQNNTQLDTLDRNVILTSQEVNKKLDFANIFSQNANVNNETEIKKLSSLDNLNYSNELRSVGQESNSNVQENSQNLLCSNADKNDYENNIKMTITEDKVETKSKPKIVRKKLKNELKENKTKRRSKQNSKMKKPEVNELTQQNRFANRRSTRKKNVMNLKEHSDSDVNCFSNSENSDPEFNLVEDKTYNCESHDDECDIETSKPVATKKKSFDKIEKNSVNRKKTKLKRRIKTNSPIKNASIEGEGDTNNVYELEYSVKPRIVSVARISNIQKLIKEKEEVSQPTKDLEISVRNKRQQDKDKLEKKIESGNLNENFVRINLKKKIYVRGKKTINMSKYKKQMWKNKKKALAGPDMDMGGCDGGSLTCFNCGQVGHFARKCPNNKGDHLLPLSAVVDEVEECPYPTLEEAAQLARGSALAVRKANIRQNKHNQTNENIETHNTVHPDHSEETDDSKSTTIVDGSFTEKIGFTDLTKDQQTGTYINGFDDSDDDLLLTETLELEKHILKIDMKQYMDSTTYVKSYFELESNGSVPETPSEVFDVLRKFGHDSFRLGQERAIMRILSGKSTLVTLSTGSGKSLCYQLPAYMYSQREPCISLIISPLVSLMEDQVTGIPAFLKAACLHTNQTKTQREKIMEAIRTGSLNVLLVSPEAVAAGEKATGFGSLLRKLPPIAFACIDEAHCVSQWSHNFRPSYLMICRILRESLGVKTILGLTATATRATADSIINHLQIPDGTDGIISDILLPDNLRLTVSRDFNRDQALLGLLLSERFATCKSIIVYCTRREECERVATFLRTTLKNENNINIINKKRKRINIQAEPYHAGMSASRRKTIQKSFMLGELRIVVATVAFGMGINKSDIRSVIHYNMPSKFESYVQEIGRAGRDGLPAYCHLFLDSQGKDENELRRHINANSMDRHVIRKLLQKIFIPCSCKTTCPKHEVAFSIQETVLALDIPEENISTLLCYLELHNNRYIEVLSPAYTSCKIISYGGPIQIRKAAKDCAPLAMALALHQNRNDDDNLFEFPVVEIASAMGWDSGICKHKLKNLEWTAENNQPKRSTLNVQFFNLGFRLLAPGNLTDIQLDEALDSLYQRVVEQEEKSLQQLNALHSTLSSVAERTYRQCISDEITENEKLLKMKTREYFHSPNPLDMFPKIEVKPFNEQQVVSDIHALICMYRDNVFTGRSIARIFHGIQSPNYPAVIWGRCKFWRSHLNDDFNSICRIATREILKLR